MAKGHRAMLPHLKKFIPFRTAAIASLSVGGLLQAYIIIVVINPDYLIGGGKLFVSLWAVSGIAIILALVLQCVGGALGRKRFRRFLIDNYTISDLVSLKDNPELTGTEENLIEEYLYIRLTGLSLSNQATRQ